MFHAAKGGFRATDAPGSDTFDWKYCCLHISPWMWVEYRAADSAQRGRVLSDGTVRICESIANTMFFPSVAAHLMCNMYNRLPSVLGT